MLYISKPADYLLIAPVYPIGHAKRAHCLQQTTLFVIVPDDSFPAPHSKLFVRFYALFEPLYLRQFFPQVYIIFIWQLFAIHGMYGAIHMSTLAIPSIPLATCLQMYISECNKTGSRRITYALLSIIQVKLLFVTVYTVCYCTSLDNSFIALYSILFAVLFH